MDKVFVQLNKYRFYPGVQEIKSLLYEITNETTIGLLPAIELIIERHDVDETLLTIIYTIVIEINKFRDDSINFVRKVSTLKFGCIVEYWRILEILNRHLKCLQISANRFEPMESIELVIDIERIKYSSIVTKFSKFKRNRFNNRVFCNDLLNILVKFLDVPCRIKK